MCVCVYEKSIVLKNLEMEFSGWSSGGLTSKTPNDFNLRFSNSFVDVTFSISFFVFFSVMAVAWSHFVQL